MNGSLIPIALLSLLLASCSAVEIVPYTYPPTNGEISSSSDGQPPVQKSVTTKKAKAETKKTESFEGKPQEGIDAAWERQMAIISSKGTESYVLSKDAVVHNISQIMSNCAGALKIHGRNGMGKDGCSEFIEYQERYNDFSALFILTAMYQKDFIDNPVESNTTYSYPAQSVLKQAYEAHDNYELIVGRP